MSTKPTTVYLVPYDDALRRVGNESMLELRPIFKDGGVGEVVKWPRAKLLDLIQRVGVMHTGIKGWSLAIADISGNYRIRTPNP